MNVLTVTLHPAIDKVLRVDSLRPNQIARCRVEMVHGGGKGNNVARALTRLKVPVLATGFQGGYTGAYITERIESEGIRTSYVQCLEPTRTSTILQVDETGDTYPLYEPGQSVTQAEIDALLERYVSLLASTSLVILCGSAQTALLAPVYAQMIELAARQRVRVILDSSGEGLRLGLAARPFMVKVNRDELGSCLGRSLEGRDEQIRAMMELREQGIPLIGLSRGEDGLIVTDGDEIWEGQLRVARILNVVGCGDSQLAGIAKEVLEEASLCEVVRWGVACGTANTQVRGAGQIDLDTVLEMLPQVTLHQVDLP